MIVFACMMLAACGSTSGSARGEDGSGEADDEYVYVDDATIEAFDADLRALSRAISNADAATEASLRASLSEMSRRYQKALLSALHDEDSTARRRIAAVLLGFTGDPSVVGPLLDKLNEDEPESVKLNAVLGLATLGAKLGEYADHKSLMSALANTMTDRDTSPAMRRAAILAYTEAHDRALYDSVQPLRDRFLGDPDPYVRIAAVNALGEIGDPAAVGDLVNVGLNHPDSEIRAASAIALGNIPDPENALPALIEASGDPNAAVRREVVHATAMHYPSDPDGVYSVLLLGLADFSEFVRESSASALAVTGDVRGIDPLLQAAGDRTAIVRRAAATSLGRLVPKEREKEAYPLVEMIVDQDPDVARASQESLVKITGKDYGGDDAAWRKYFYTTYPELDPANAYAGKPRPRFTSGIYSGGSRTTSSRSSSSRSSNSRSSSRGSSGTRSSTRNQPADRNNRNR